MDHDTSQRTKYVVLIGDGMADYETEELSGRTPLEVGTRSPASWTAPRTECGVSRYSGKVTAGQREMQIEQAEQRASSWIGRWVRPSTRISRPRGPARVQARERVG